MVSHVRNRFFSPPFASIAKGEVFVLLYVFCYPPFASIAKGEVFVLLYVCLFFCFFVFLFFCLFGQRFLDNPRADSRQSSHTGVLWFRMCLLPFWGLAAVTYNGGLDPLVANDFNFI